jgi:hypothetical protein
VQVKSRTTSAELAQYVDRLDDLGPYDWMFYVYHSGEAENDDERVRVIRPEKLAEMVVNAGLVNCHPQSFVTSYARQVGEESL